MSASLAPAARAAAVAAALGPNIRAVYVIGETAEELARAIPGTVHAGDLATAVERAGASAQPGEVVLLSPACASYDQYSNYEERGAHFRELAKE